MIATMKRTDRSATARGGDERAGGILEGGRWIAGAAFAYVAAWVLGLGIGLVVPGPAPTDSAPAIGTALAAHRQAVMLQAYLLDGVAGIALVAFAAALRDALRPFARPGGVLASLLFGAGVAAGTVSLLQGLFTQVLADRAAALGDAATITALSALNAEGDTYKLLALGVCIAAASQLILRTRALPTWLGWLGLALAPLLVVAGWNFLLSAAAQYAAYTVLLLALLAWAGAVGVASWRRAG